METLLQIFKENPAAIKINDQLYSKFPEYNKGIKKYLYAVTAIRDCLLTGKNPKDLVALINTIPNTTAFFEAIGKETQVLRKYNINLESKPKNETVKTLQHELRIRLGKESGKINPILNKYFTFKGKLNSKGLVLVTQ
jgi:hypothetical protein